MELLPRSTCQMRFFAPQLQERFALERRSLTLWQSPASTLRHFAANASNTVVRGLLWAVHHRLTLFIALPLASVYLGLKHTGAPEPVTLSTPRRPNAWEY